MKKNGFAWSPLAEMLAILLMPLLTLVIFSNAGAFVPEEQQGIEKDAIVIELAQPKSDRAIEKKRASVSGPFKVVD